MSGCSCCPPPPSGPTCFHCGATGDKSLLLCSACKCVWFCNRDCQKATWKGHKSFCQSLQALSMRKGGVLVVDGMGALGSQDFFTTAVQRALQQQQQNNNNDNNDGDDGDDGDGDGGVCTIHVDGKLKKPAEHLAALLKSSGGECSSNRYWFRAVILLGWGSGSEELAMEFAKSAVFARALVEYVARDGGRLLVHGERIRQCCGNWPLWFNLQWQSSDYLRTNAVRNEKSWAAANQQLSLPPMMNVKACMVSGMEPADALYVTDENSLSHSMVPTMSGRKVTAGQSPFTLAQVGKGTVSFFGDVNAESVTMDVMAAIVNGKAHA